MAQAWRCRVLWTGTPGQGYAYNIVHLFVATLHAPPDQSSTDDIAQALRDAFTVSDWHNVVSDQVTLSDVFVSLVDPDPQPEFIGHIGETGDESSNVLPPNVALVTSLRTSIGGRSGRGRIFNAGLTEIHNVGGGLPDATVRDALTAGWSAFHSNLLDLDGGDQISLGVYSRVLDQVNFVTTLSTDGVWDSQRRRTR